MRRASEKSMCCVVIDPSNRLELLGPDGGAPLLRLDQSEPGRLQKNAGL